MDWRFFEKREAFKMPRITRWFPVSHDINSDPEVWELTDKFGDRALRVWLQILSIADRNDGLIKGSLKEVAQSLMRVYSKGNQRWIRDESEKLQRALRWASEKGWISLRQASDSYQKPVREGSEDALIVVNFAKYHRTREPNKFPRGGKIVPSLPNLPNLPNLFKEEDKNKSGELEKTAWPLEDTWLLKLLQKTPCFESAREDYLSEYAWWEDVARAVGNLPQEFIEMEFAKMSAWFRENPQRKPTAKGMRRFIRNWLEKAKEDQRLRKPAHGVR
jgi:hypothetical protein